MTLVWQWPHGYETKCTGNKNKSKEAGPCQTQKLLHSKSNNQQSEETWSLFISLRRRPLTENQGVQQLEPKVSCWPAHDLDGHEVIVQSKKKFFFNQKKQNYKTPSLELQGNVAAIFPAKCQACRLRRSPSLLRTILFRTFVSYGKKKHHTHHSTFLL